MLTGKQRRNQTRSQSTSTSQRFNCSLEAYVYVAFHWLVFQTKILFFFVRQNLKFVVVSFFLIMSENNCKFRYSILENSRSKHSHGLRVVLAAVLCLQLNINTIFITCRYGSLLISYALDKNKSFLISIK